MPGASRLAFSSGMVVKPLDSMPSWWTSERSNPRLTSEAIFSDEDEPLPIMMRLSGNSLRMRLQNSVQKNTSQSPRSLSESPGVSKSQPLYFPRTGFLSPATSRARSRPPCSWRSWITPQCGNFSNALR